MIYKSILIYIGVQIITYMSKNKIYDLIIKKIILHNITLGNDLTLK